MPRSDPPADLLHDRAEEVQRFKVGINLTEYAASAGYALDRAGSSAACVAMKGPAGDKILIARARDLHWIYCSVSDPQDQGTIIDFVQRRSRIGLGEVRRLLRPWSQHGGGVAVPGAPLNRPPAEAWVADVSPSEPDPQAVRAGFEGLKPLTGPHPYLTARGVPAGVYLGRPFRGRVLMDARGNAVFPHYGDEREVVGWEAKNRGFTGFSKGGTKGLFVGLSVPVVSRVVVVESAIDALSYAALHPDAEAVHASTSGVLNPQQPRLLRRLFGRLRAGGEVVVATDHDAGGEALADQIGRIHAALPSATTSLRRHRPAAAGTDWNDELQAARPT